MKIIIRISGVIILLILIHSCKEKPTPPIISTAAVSEISYFTATSGGDVTNDGGDVVIARGICWNTSAEPTISNSKTTESGGVGAFTSSITQLTSKTLYYVRAYATNGVGTGYGDQVTFSTHQVAVPVLTTTAITSITQTTAISGGNITDDKGGSVIARGVCWEKTPNPTLAGFKSEDGIGTGSFISSITGLTAGTTYYLRAYSTNSAGTSYGNELSFTTNPATTPVLTTISVSSIMGNTATSGGNITYDGGAPISSRGICWRTTVNPTILDRKTLDGIGIGAFTSSMTVLEAVTIYYVRAYATNIAGTSYGNEISFTTATGVPTVTTSEVSLITQTTATCGGIITTDGGLAVTDRGVCWSTSPNPTITNSKTYDGIEIGSFTSYITGLSPNTLYYVRAFATNAAGTGYGTSLSFTPIIGAIIFNPNLTYGTLTDIEGNVYKTIIIGSQTWMAENLKTGKYSDGTTIPLVAGRTDWINLGTHNSPGYCWYDNDQVTYKATFGALYNWNAVSTGKLCPAGWHIPNLTEWTVFTDYLGGASVAGGKMKESGVTHWLTPNEGATNEIGFTALPGGYREFAGNFNFQGSNGFWWSSTGAGTNNAYSRRLDFNYVNIFIYANNNEDGISVRCIKD